MESKRTSIFDARISPRVAESDRDVRRQAAGWYFIPLTVVALGGVVVGLYARDYEFAMVAGGAAVLCAVLFIVDLYQETDEE
jgi:hypothetical protein